MAQNRWQTRDFHNDNVVDVSICVAMGEDGFNEIFFVDENSMELIGIAHWLRNSKELLLTIMLGT